MRIDQIALLIGAGAISGANIYPAPMKPGKWYIEFIRKGGERIALSAQRGNIRDFASLDSAWKVLNDLDIRTATIHNLREAE